MTDLPIIERRRIEAQILKNVHEVIEARSGLPEADAIIGEAVTQSAIEQGKEFAARLDHAPDLQDFADILPNWTKGGSLEIDMLHTSAERLEFNVTRCRYAEMYREMGLGRIGHLLSCNRDGDFCIGYNPQMELTRTQTIMKGASHCDFRYRMKTEA
ncbi:L-2-amino-thiazoline-4-carboxylic acid hydrolase [Paracoccus sp. (in: a-proteobacteria)]|uniref:L-2-amino-thiazoline-4-carboxylic acid hydrolase n=1 Tax=Paracoccus sp. TaxID=267 RepID=UPI002B0009DC|nr:L-2-amino-thiazoline-4-carboxylic acid hydrolase [Paracoccus sp. (in: a-proteobacteria)]